MIATADQFISVKVYVDLPESQEIEDHFNVRAIPQNIFVNAEGEEVDRIVGYFPPEEFRPKVLDILNGKNTLQDLENRLGETPEDIKILTLLGKKYGTMGRDDDSREMYEKILIQNPGSELAGFHLSKLQLKSGNPDVLSTFIRENRNSEYLSEAFDELIFHYKNNNDIEKEVEISKQWVSVFSDDPDVLNAYAWRMSELDMNLESALELARKAVKLSASDSLGQAMIIDTEAEILWKLGRIDEAIETIDRSIQINPNDTYYQDQKKKFQSPPESEQEV